MEDIFQPLLYFWLLLEVTAMIINLFGNSVLIYVMSREKKLRKKSSFYIISIAVADLLTCVFTIPLILIRIKVLQTMYLKDKDPVKEIIPERHCIWLLSIMHFLTMASVFQFLFVSIDRYWAICQPKFYLKRTAKFTKCVSLMCWISGFIVGMTPWMSQKTGKKCNLHESHYIFLSSATLLILAVVIVLYCMIYRAFKKQVIMKLHSICHCHCHCVTRVKDFRTSRIQKLKLVCPVDMKSELPKLCFMSLELLWSVGFL